MIWRAANSLATSIRQSLSVLCLWVLSILRFLNVVFKLALSSSVARFSVSEQKKGISCLMHCLLDLQEEVYIWL